MAPIKLFFQSLDSGNWLSIFSICLSIVVGGFNIFYTNRLFKAAYYPLIKIGIEDKDCETGICILLKLENASKDRAIYNGRLQLFIKNPQRFYILPARKWVRMIEKENITINASGEFSVLSSQVNGGSSLEQFMLLKFPKYIKSEKNGQTQFTYFLSHDKTIQVRATLSYDPGFSGAKKKTIIQNLPIHPNCKKLERSKFRLNYWKF